MESPEIDPDKQNQLILDKGAKEMKWSNDSLFNKWCWDNYTSTCENMNPDTDIIPFTKVNSQWIIDPKYT